MMEYLLISGQVLGDGIFVPAWWRSSPERVPLAKTADPSGDWSVAALDVNQNVLSEAAASLSEVSVCPGNKRIQLETQLALPEGATVVIVRVGERDAYRRAVPHRAGVRVEGPSGAIPERRVELRLHIDGPPPQQGAYLVARWEAPNDSLLPLGVMDLSGGERTVLIPLDFSQLPGGNNCRLSVIYNDGIHTVETSLQFSLPLRKGVPVIVAPTSETPFVENCWVFLQGRLDGDGDPQQLEWFLNDAHVASGPYANIVMPRAGREVLSLRLGDAATQLPVVVRRGRRTQATPWIPPWRVRPARLQNAPPELNDDNNQSDEFD
jgi:hypothetical protein